MPELGSPDGPALAGARVRGAVAVVIGGVEANPLSNSGDFSELSMWRFNGFVLPVRGHQKPRHASKRSRVPGALNMKRR